LKETKKILTPEQNYTILETLKTRFEKNMFRHKNILWSDVREKVEKKQGKLWSLYEMERTGGEPDIIEYHSESSDYSFFDCSEESPKGRRSFCYDHNALESRKEHKPVNSATEAATNMGTVLLNEEQYRELQKWGDFDTKTSSWLETPFAIRVLGGAIFGDFRYGHVFVYHNGAESYYASRGFRTVLSI
jgi:hypothetical protein